LVGVQHHAVITLVALQVNVGYSKQEQRRYSVIANKMSQ
jgi:hypothetical protein